MRKRASNSVVIPGRREAASPESITTPRVLLAAFAANKRRARSGFILRKWPKGQARS
jgi:hypothetical protein